MRIDIAPGTGVTADSLHPNEQALIALRLCAPHRKVALHPLAHEGCSGNEPRLAEVGCLSLGATGFQFRRAFDHTLFQRLRRLPQLAIALAQRLGGVDAQIGRASETTSAGGDVFGHLAEDMVAQRMSVYSFAANLRTVETQDRVLGALLDAKA